MKTLPDEQTLRNIVGSTLCDDEPLSDNVAIAMCGYFESHPSRPEDDRITDDHPWGVWVEEQANLTLKRIVDAVIAAAPEHPEAGAGGAEVLAAPGIASIAQGRNSGRWVDLDRLHEPGVMRANILRGIIKLPSGFGELQPLLDRISELEAAQPAHATPQQAGKCICEHWQRCDVCHPQHLYHSEPDHGEDDVLCPHNRKSRPMGKDNTFAGPWECMDCGKAIAEAEGGL